MARQKTPAPPPAPIHAPTDLKIFKALEARTDGKSVQDIAEDLDLSPKEVNKLITMGLELMNDEAAEKAEEVRQIELMRLDRIVATHMPHILIPRHADIILKTMERRARYLALDTQPETNGQEDAATALRTFLAAARSNTGVESTPTEG